MRAVWIGVGIVGLATLVSAIERPASSAFPPERPRTGMNPSFVGSNACRACHPSEHASFTRTFHRTMTQDARPRNVLGKMDGQILERRGDAVYAGEKRVALLTGSHREQTYWVHGERKGELRLLPWVWLVKEQRFIPRKDAFLVPPEVPLPNVRWNSNCIACHAVAGEPRHDAEHDAFESRVAELGIACEACHGPGAAHAEKQRDPVTRYVQHASKAGDPTIVHPMRLSADRSTALCGQCHSYAYPKDENEWWTSGYAKTFRAGDDLQASRTVLAPDAGKSAPEIDAPMESLFWPDGTIRVGGREYNGLVLSACYARGEGEKKITCLSCHAMHEGDPVGQIAPKHLGDRGCTSCHSSIDAGHTHHAVGSPGSECVACHMPKTSYALFSAVRSHRIERPRGDDAKPNACNLCHLDKSLGWTEQQLGKWYGRRTGERGWMDEPGDAAGALWALSGDAAVRVVVADALGSQGALAATRRPGFHAAVVAELLEDPYAAVRFVAARTRDALPAGASAGELPSDLVTRLRAARDNRPITIAE